MIRDEALLLLSELTTNALLHGRPAVEVRLSRDRRHLTLEVHDCAPTLPRRAHPTEDDDSIGFDATFPTAGAYRLFLQFKVNGSVQTAAFTQEVR